ncbi:hypothetical protein HN873_033046, partial [Arachis hypogaea]
MEYHAFESNNVFCIRLTFVPKEKGGIEIEEEDDYGWIIAFVHNEDIDLSQLPRLHCHAEFVTAFMPIYFQPL